MAAPAVVTAPPAGAISDSGGNDAGASIVGRGDLMSWILGRRAQPGHQSGSGSTGTAPQCWWRTLPDLELAWFIAAVAYTSGALDPDPLRAQLIEALELQGLSGGDLQMRLCDGALDGFRVVAATGDPVVRSGRHQLVTTLPLPEPVISPPPGVAVPLGEPVFVSFPDQAWHPIMGTLDADGLTVQVRAEPTGVRVFSGEPDGALVDCIGPGIAFDPDSADSPRRQSVEPGRCSFDYSTESDPDAPWLGFVTVFWRAEWRGVDGQWRPLGTVARTVITQRATRSIRTALERG